MILRTGSIAHTQKKWKFLLWNAACMYTVYASVRLVKSPKKCILYRRGSDIKTIANNLRIFVFKIAVCESNALKRPRYYGDLSVVWCISLLVASIFRSMWNVCTDFFSAVQMLSNWRHCNRIKNATYTHTHTNSRTCENCKAQQQQQQQQNVLYRRQEAWIVKNQ